MTSTIADLASRVYGEVANEGHPLGSQDVVDVVEVLSDVQPGTLFCCVRGSRTDGHSLSTEALSRGAVGLVVDHVLTDVDSPQIVVEDVRAAIGPIAALLAGNPAGHLTMVGITGTNGKTTTAQVLGHVLSSAGHRVGVIGTLSGSYTSPPASRLHRQLAQFVDEGMNAVVMEVSSHALHQHRVRGVHFAVGAFTNLSQDHLDYHATMEDYFSAKAALFSSDYIDTAVINVDSQWGKRLVSIARDQGVREVVECSSDDAIDVGYSLTGTCFEWRGQSVQIPLVGEFNVANCVGAMSCASALGLDDELIAKSLSSCPAVPGRLESIDQGQPFSVLVDFAHTPDGLEKVLSTIEGVKAPQGRVLTVFGCGGDRDREKRPLMGRVVEDRSDRVFVTSDNPRNEDPAVIADQACAGMRNPNAAVVELDRRKAIELALTEATAQDVVLIAGKGHETTQEIGGRKIDFDDREVARDILRAVYGSTRPAGGRSN